MFETDVRESLTYGKKHDGGGALIASREPNARRPLVSPSHEHIGLQYSDSIRVVDVLNWR